MSDSGRSLAGGNLPTLAVGTFLIVLAALTAYDASQLRQPVTDVGVGPSTFPMLIAGGLAILGLLTIKSAFDGHTVNLGIPNKMPLFWLVGGIVSEILLLNVIGFTLATGLMFAMAARGFAKRSFFLLLPVGVLVALIAYLGFRFGLQLYMPEGPLERLI